MNKLNKSQFLLLLVLVFLLVMTPLLRSSLRTPYLYFIINLLIIALGAETGLFSVFSRPLEEKNQSASVIQQPAMLQEAKSEKRRASSTTAVPAVLKHKEKNTKGTEKFVSEKTVDVTKVVDEGQRDTSVPSLFFIVGGESEAEGMDEEFEAEDEIGGINGQELFTKLRPLLETSTNS